MLPSKIGTVVAIVGISFLVAIVAGLPPSRLDEPKASGTSKVFTLNILHC